MSFFGKRRTSENQAGQEVDLDSERTKLHEQRWRGVQLTISLWPSFGHVLNITWPQAWWNSPLASETSQLIWVQFSGCVEEYYFSTLNGKVINVLSLNCCNCHTFCNNCDNQHISLPHFKLWHCLCRTANNSTPQQQININKSNSSKILTTTATDRDGFEDSMFEAKARPLRGQGQGQGQNC